MSDKETLKNEASKTDKRKQSLYFPESMLQEIKEEAARLDRSLSWVVQRAWKLARVEIKKLPSVNDINEDEDEGEEELPPRPRSSGAPHTAVGLGECLRNS